MYSTFQRQVESRPIDLISRVENFTLCCVLNNVVVGTLAHTALHHLK